MSKNFEYKAKVIDLEKLEREFVSCGAVFENSMSQVDTYLNVNRGRMKIRLINGDRTELIFYERDEKHSDSMISLYEVVPIYDKRIVDIFEQALNVKVKVEKVRKLLILKNARIHLDDVKNLGKFLEIEVVSNGNDEDDRKLLQNLKSIASRYVETEIKRSYSDLALALE